MPINGKGGWAVMETPVARDPRSELFQKLLNEEVADQVGGSTGLPRSEFTPNRWDGGFQVLKYVSSPLLTPNVARTTNGEIS